MLILRSIRREKRRHCMYGDTEICLQSHRSNCFYLLHVLAGDFKVVKDNVHVRLV
jgi:hypothetical protein